MTNLLIIHYRNWMILEGPMLNLNYDVYKFFVSVYLLVCKIFGEYLYHAVFIQVDIPIKYLGFFLEDDAELEHIKKVGCSPPPYLI